MKVIRDICYSTIGHECNFLDMYLPECEEFPVFIYFHGGGFEVGDKYDKYHFFPKVVCFCIPPVIDSCNNQRKQHIQRY